MERKLTPVRRGFKQAFTRKKQEWVKWRVNRSNILKLEPIWQDPSDISFQGAFEEHARVA